MSNQAQYHAQYVFEVRAGEACAVTDREGKSNTVGYPKKLGLFGSKTICALIAKSIECSDGADRWSVEYSAPSFILNGHEESMLGKAKSLFGAYKAFRKTEIACFVYIGRRTSIYARIAKLAGNKIVYFWIGSDAHYLLEGKYPKRELEYCAKVNLHLADGESLRDELAEVGIDAQVAYIVPSLEIQASAMPEEHAVLLNIPDHRTDFYNLPLILEVVRGFPALRFVAVRSEKPELYNEDNIDFRGTVPYEDMEQIYNDVSIVLRFPVHDSLSLVSMEAIARGKQVISRFPFPTSIQVRSKDEIIAALRELIETPPQLNQEGIDFYESHFAPSEAGNLLVERLDELVVNKN